MSVSRGRILSTVAFLLLVLGVVLLLVSLLYQKVRKPAVR